MNDDLLNQVNIRADYLVKYQNFLQETLKTIDLKDVTGDDIEDEKAFVDKDENLIIEIGIKNKKFQFKIPKEAWSF